MEKIKASKVFERLGFRYMWVEGLRSIIVSTHTRESRDGRCLFLGTDMKTVDLDRNEYEIDFSEDLMQERFPTFPHTKDPDSIFKLNDTVHVLSYSNVGEFGKSTDGIIETIYKDGTVLVKVDEGIEEVHKEDNVSFTPFSIKEAGFSQVRPVKKGQWGWFWDNDDYIDDGYRYAMFECIDGKRFMNSNGMCYDRFSPKNPVQHC